MRTYELMVVAKKDFPHDDEKKREELISKLLTDQPVSDVVVTDFGKRKLAYEIRHESEGCYILATFKADAINVSAVESQVKLMDGILRYLLTKMD